MALKENGLKVLESIGDQNVTAADISEATNIPVKVVNGFITSVSPTSHRKVERLCERVAAEILLEDGTTKAVKFIRLTQKGKEFKPDEEPASTKKKAE